MRCLPGFLNPESDTESNAAARTIGDLWCRLMHSSIMWPVHGYYACATCGRLYPVPWANIHGVVLAGTAPMPEKKFEQPNSTIRLEAETSMRLSTAGSSSKA